MRQKFASPLRRGDVASLYLDGRLVGWMTAGALILDPDLTPVEQRYMTAKAVLAAWLMTDGAMPRDPDLWANLCLDEFVRAALIPVEDLERYSDDQLIADLYFVPVEQVASARIDHLRRELEAGTI